MGKHKFKKGSYVWLPDKHQVFSLGEVHSSFNRGEPGTVFNVETEELINISPNETMELLMARKDIFREHKDLSTLKSLDEPSLLYSIRRRYYEDQIYTSVGPILIAVNPFKELPYYTNDVLVSCIEGTFESPHIFSLASRCYDQMLRNQTNQSCVVSGESGAGKTEATKLILQCLTERASSVSSQNMKSLKFQQKILEINPLLEAFGNAKTLRNDNSSRFGKLTQMFISQNTGDILGVGIVDYLLEKSRIVTHTKGERNYHIFYQMLTDSILTQEYSLLSPEKYYYLSPDGNPEEVYCDTLNDAENWKLTTDAMEELGIPANDIKSLEKVLVGLLSLGNIAFHAKTEHDASSVVESKVNWLEEASSSLGLDVNKLRKALLTTEINVRGDVTYKEHTKQQAIDARDALAKSIYHALFMWLIKKINQQLRPTSSEPQLSINILDIFGFESFELNSFEQLCINYCNEKLQVHFVDSVFKAEEQAYLEEGIVVSRINFIDTSRVIELFESRPTGLFFLLDEQNKLPTGGDEKFLRNILKKSKEFRCLQPPKGKEVRKNKFMALNFNITHFAGEVSYNVLGFLEKNSDKLLAKLESIVMSSNFGFLQGLCVAYAKTKKLGKTLGLKFKKQLAELLQVLNSSEPHFVRTIKPNQEKVPDRLDSSMVLHQIRCAGLLGVCDIHKNGFPVRFSFAEFLYRYRGISDSKANTAQKLVAQLIDENILTEKVCQVGKSKVFLKNAAGEKLEVLRDEKLAEYAIKLQSIVRGYLARKRVGDIKESIYMLQEALKRNDPTALQSALDVVKKGKGSHIVSNLILDAKLALKRIKEIKSIIADLALATKKRDAALIVSLLNGLNGFDDKMISQNSVVTEAENILKDLRAQNQPNMLFDLSSTSLKTYLDQVWDKMCSTSGISNKDVEQLNTLVEQLYGTDNKQRYQEAEALLEFAKLQLEIQEFVAVALESEEREDLDTAMDLIQKINLQTIDAGKVIKMQVKLMEKEQNKDALSLEQKTLNLRTLASSMKINPGVEGTTIREKLLLSTQPNKAQRASKFVRTSQFIGSTKGFKSPVKNARLSAVVNLSLIDEQPRTRMFGPNRGNNLSLSVKRIMSKQDALLPDFKDKALSLSNFFLLHQNQTENLSWTGFPITKSFTNLNGELAKMAIQLNRSILQYCGDEKFQYPSSAAQKILQMGISQPLLCNELYIQVLRNIKDNKKPTSEAKSWILLVLVTQLVPATNEFHPFVKAFLNSYANLPLLVGNSARLCLAQLSRTIKLGVSDAVPDIDLITQYSSRPALLLDIKSSRRNVKGELVNVLLPCYPDTEVDTILDCACEVLGLNPSDFGKFGLFVKGKKIDLKSKIRERLHNFYTHWDPIKLKHVDYFATLYQDKEEELFKALESKYGPEPKGTNKLLPEANDFSAEDFFYALPWWMYPGDVFMKFSFKGKETVFSIKQKLIFRRENLTLELLEQTRELIACGELGIIRYQDIISLAAIAFNLRNDCTVASRETIVKHGLEYILPKVWLNEHPAEELLNAVLDSCQNHTGNQKYLIKSFFEQCKKAEGYGVWFYPVTQVKSFSPRQGETISPLDFIGVSHRGLHLFDSSRTETIQLFPFELITEYGADSDVVWFHFKTPKGNDGPQAEFTTEFGWEIYAILQAYLEATKSKKDRPRTSFNRYAVFTPRS